MSKDKTTRQDSDQIVRAGVEDMTVRASSEIIPAGVQGPTVITSDAAEILLNQERYLAPKFMTASGEAEVYLVEKDGKSLVLKLYYSRFTPKMEIVANLKGLKHADIIELMDYGYYQNRFFEIMEYAEGGSLDEALPIRETKVLKQVVAETLNAFDYCHNHGIIHRDIKPQNLFFRMADKTDLALGDFGISTALVEGFSKKLSVQARTTIYAAPEIHLGAGGKTIIDCKVDYYSLGISLIHLWTGKEPFEGLGEYGIMRVKIEGRVDIPDDLPAEFKHLIKGLLTIEPPKRWGYEEVQKWLKGEKVDVYYRTYKPEYKEFVFGVIKGEQIVVSDPADLADLMDKHPDTGIRLLYKKGLSRWIEQVNVGVFAEIENIVDDEYPRDQTAGLTKAIYLLDPDRPFRGVDGRSYATRDELADCLERSFDHYEKELQSASAPFYLFLEARGYKEEADKFRKLFKTASSRAALNTLILFLQGEEALVIGDYRIQKPEELSSVDSRTRARLVKDLADPDSKLSIWMLAFPDLKDGINRWRSLKRFDETSLRYALKEGFVHAGANARNTKQLKQLLKEQPRDLDWKEANYWLKNYVNASMNELIVDLLSTGEFDDDDFLALSSYVLNNHEDLKLDIFKSLEGLLPAIGKR